jgi:uncharacterized OB-fold protein
MRGDFNLPPGCRPNDIDESAGDFKLKCDDCGHWFWTRNPERRFCDNCKSTKRTDQ